ncbi:hypothetical protein J1N35_033496 [Gossypium stocksii]|uniref:Glutathione peroxidase n=1 Tax=Gossypium stocksii TaxID=47602 RepID=A0A9D3ZNE5_9ROSI|nr:hypothetical protein J1N35_033496 [Gossypium stocksii]
MASMPFFATIPSPLLDFSQAKKNPVFSLSWPSMSFSIPSIKSSLGSSKSAFFQHGFSLPSLTAFGFNSRSSGIHARAATDRPLYDYTVKVQAWGILRFEILAFPCNQFGGQEPGSNPDIKKFACTKFKAEFPIFDKFLKSSVGGFFGDLIKWNFYKFLVDKNGKLLRGIHQLRRLSKLRYARSTPG